MIRFFLVCKYKIENSYKLKFLMMFKKVVDKKAFFKTKKLSRQVFVFCQKMDIFAFFSTKE